MKINFTVKYKKKIDGLLGQVLPIGRLAQHLSFVVHKQLERRGYIDNWVGKKLRRQWAISPPLLISPAQKKQNDATVITNAPS